MPPRRLPVALALVASLSLVAACSSAAGTATPGAAATTGTTGSEAPLATTGTGATEAPGASIDVSGAADALAHLQSYKVTLQVTGANAANVETTVVNGATPAKQVTLTSGSRVTRIIEIGSDVWVDEGTGTFVKGAMPKAAADAMLMAFDPAVLMSTVKARPELGFLENKGTEQKNGINAVHLHADQNTQLPAGASPIPAGTVFDLWVAVDGGYVVALEATNADPGDAGTVQIEVTKVNDPSLQVTPPA